MAKKTTSWVRAEIQQGPQSNYVITVYVSPQEKESLRNTALLEYQKDATKPGFRKWHVPLSMVEQMVNPGTLMMAIIEELINDGIQQILSQYPDHKFIGQPYGLDTTHYNDEDKAFLKFSLDVYPDLVEKNKKWKDIKAVAYDTAVTQQEIDATVDQLRSSYANFDVAEEVVEGVLSRVKVTYLHKKETLGHSKNQYLGWEEIEHHKDIVKELLGKKVGDTISLPYKKVEGVTLLHYQEKEGDQPTDVSLEIIDLRKKVLPELNQDFIDKVFTKDDNITSVEVLIEKIKETLTTNKSTDALYQWVNTYISDTESSFDIVIPQTLIDEETKSRIAHLSKQLGGEKGLKAYFERMGEADAQKYIEEIKQSGITSMKKFFVMRYICDDLWLNLDWSQVKEGEAEHALYEKLVPSS